MIFPNKAAALAAGFVAAVALVGPGASGSAQTPKSPGAETLVVDDATLDWIEQSKVAALREGVIERMELEIGMPATKGKPIGYLHAEMADLTVKKANVTYSSQSPMAKAIAQRELAMAVVARNRRLNERIPGAVSNEDVQKAEAELKVAEAMKLEAQEKRGIDKAELDLAQRALEEHTIVAPFDGIVIERMKNPGESVRAGEAVVRLGNLGKLRAYFWVPLEYAYRVKEGQVVEFQPRLAGDRHATQSIEQKRFQGKVTFVDPQIQAIAETAVRVYAEFNNKDFELKPGLKGGLTIYLGSDAAPAATAVGARTSPAEVGR